MWVELKSFNPFVIIIESKRENRRVRPDFFDVSGRISGRARQRVVQENIHNIFTIVT